MVWSYLFQLIMWKIIWTVVNNWKSFVLNKFGAIFFRSIMWWLKRRFMCNLVTWIFTSHMTFLNNIYLYLINHHIVSWKRTLNWFGAKLFTQIIMLGCVSIRIYMGHMRFTMHIMKEIILLFFIVNSHCLQGYFLFRKFFPKLKKKFKMNFFNRGEKAEDQYWGGVVNYFAWELKGFIYFVILFLKGE